MSHELYTEPFLGFRVWRMDTSNITGVVYTSCVWEPNKPSRAICMKSLNYKREIPLVPCLPPELKCNDGFFGYYTVDLLKRSGLPFTHTMMAIRGSFQAWGKVVLHEDGFRAEYVQPIAFIDETVESIAKWVPQAYYPAAIKKNKDNIEDTYLLRKSRVRGLGKKYDVPIVPEEDIEEFSKQYGSMPAI